MDMVCDELGEAHEGVWGQGGSEWVVRGSCGQGSQVAKEDGPGFFLQSQVGVGGGVGRRNLQRGY